MNPPSATEPLSRRQAGSERRRQAVLDTARHCFGRDGYAGATIARIADEAGVSTGLVYQFFRNKDELYEVVLAEVIRDWVREMVRFEAEDTALEKLEGMFRRSVEFCRNHPLLPALMADDPALQLNRLRVVASDRVTPHRELVADILREGIAAGELHPNLEVAGTADIICQLQADYSRRAYVKDPLFPLTDRIIDAAIQLIRSGIT